MGRGGREPLVINDQLGASNLPVHQSAAAPVDVVDIPDVDMHGLDGVAQLGGDAVPITPAGDVLVLQTADREGLRDLHRLAALWPRPNRGISPSGGANGEQPARAF